MQEEKTTINDSKITMGFLIPLILLVIPCLELCLVPPPEKPGLTQYRLSNSPFMPNGIFELKQPHQNATMGNLPWLEPSRTCLIHTDRFGYKNIPTEDSEPPDAIVDGDSFSTVGTKQDEFLPNQIAKFSGRRVYNAASFPIGGDYLYPPIIQGDPRRILALAKKLKMTRGVVIHEKWIDTTNPTIRGCQLDPSDSDRKEFCGFLNSVGLGEELASFRGWFYRPSVLRRFTRKLHSLAQDVSLLPRPAMPEKCRVSELLNGDKIYFFDFEINSDKMKDPKTVEFWSWYQKKLAKHGLKLLVVLVPNKYMIYKDLLKEKPAIAADENIALDYYEAELTQRQIPVVNLTSVLRTAAKKRYEKNGKNQYVFYRDDHHLNSAGVRTAAKEVAKALNAILEDR